MKTALNFMIAGSEVKRYHTVRTIAEETVGHHSHGVAMLCLLLTQNRTAALLTAALMHDLAEHVLGDIPSPAKRHYGITKQISDMEDTLLVEADLVMPILTVNEERILKLADLAQGAIFCAREIEMGNTTMYPIYERYCEYAHPLIQNKLERDLFAAIHERVGQ